MIKQLIKIVKNINFFIFVCIFWKWKIEGLNPLSIYKNYIDKTLVYDDQDAYIYQRGDTKSGIWYFRIYNKKTGKPVFKSLKTTDKVQATAAARVIYMDIKGKIDRGENLKSITTKELTSLWLEKLKSTISNIPHEGITEGSYKSKRYWMRNWNEYIRIKNLATTPIDRIKPPTNPGRPDL